MSVGATATTRSVQEDEVLDEASDGAKLIKTLEVGFHLDLSPSIRMVYDTLCTTCNSLRAIDLILLRAMESLRLTSRNFRKVDTIRLNPWLTRQRSIS